MAGPAARILSPSPDATNGVSCATRREARVTGFDCGAGAGLFYRRYPTDPVASSLPEKCAGVPGLCFRATPTETREGLTTNDADGTPSGITEASRVDSRSRAAAARPGNRRGATPEHPASGRHPDQPRPARPERAPLRVPDAKARLERPTDAAPRRAHEGRSRR